MSEVLRSIDLLHFSMLPSVLAWGRILKYMSRLFNFSFFFSGRGKPQIQLLNQWVRGHNYKRQTSRGVERQNLKRKFKLFLRVFPLTSW
jgi:hypothetical protein